MKKLAILAITLMLVLGTASMAMASQRHISQAWVDPNWNNSYDSTTLSGTARYYITITESWGAFTGVKEVEVDVYNQVFVSFVVTPVLPADWTFQLIPGGSIAKLSLGNAGTPLLAGDTLIFDAAYQLTDTAENLAAAGYWYGGTNTNRPWCQGFSTSELNSAGEPINSHGDATDPIPEPTTMLLFGSGIALIGYMRKKG